MYGPELGTSAFSKGVLCDNPLRESMWPATQ